MIHTLGTTSNSALRCLPGWAANLAPADVAALAQTITGDGKFGSVLAGFSPGASAVVATGNTNGNTTLNSLVAVAGAPLSQIRPGDIVIGFPIGVPLGTRVAAVLSGTSVQLSNAATLSTNGYVAFVRPGSVPLELGSATLDIPGGRGRLLLHPGDVVALDNIGFPYLIPGNSINYPGSLWDFT